MKYAFFLILLLPLFAAAQDCKPVRVTDPYTKETSISSGFIELDNGSLTIDADSREIDLFFSLEGTEKCFDNTSMAAVFFEGTKLKLSSRNTGTMNCKGYFHFTFRNTASVTGLLQKISTQKMTHIIFTGNNKAETTVTLTPEQQEVIMKLADCILKEAKTLIKS